MGIGKSTALSLAEAGAEKETTIEGSNECEGNKTRAAKILGISRKSLFNKLRQYNIVNEDMPNEE
jgi:transcriptional regulator of acetoin/glycerol metabolism